MIDQYRARAEGRPLLWSFLLSTCTYIIGFISGAVVQVPTRTSADSSSSLTMGTIDLITTNGTVLLLLLFGSVTFSVLTFLNLFFNGILFGHAIGELIVNGVAIGRILRLTVPHIVFELPAFWLAGGIAYATTWHFWEYLSGKKQTPLTGDEIRYYSRLTALAGMLVIVGAWMEANVSITAV